MTSVVFIAGAIALLVAGLLRAGAASLVRTPRADALQDASEGVPGANRVAVLLEEADLIVPSINIVHSILLLLAAIPTTWALTVDTKGGPASLIYLLALGVTLALVGDLLPRMAGRSRPRKLAYRLSRLLKASVGFGSRAVEMIFEEPEDDEDESDENNEGEVGLIESVLGFSETIVREVMVPRTDMVTVQATAPLGVLLDLIEEHGYSRIPVVGDGIDDVVGMVIAKDLLLRLANGDRPELVSEVMRPIDHIPETKRIPELLRDMQASKSHMAVVVDEFGGTAGLVTIEDLLEELVGEIVDEFDDDELLCEELEDGTWKVDGRLSVDELSEVIDLPLPDEEWDTVAGLVLGLAGRVPREQERFEIDGVALTVKRVQGRRVQQVEVERLPQSMSEAR